MFWDKPKCIECDQEVQENDVVFIKMRYPKSKGVTEIKAYLRKEGQFIYEDCFNKRSL